MVFICRIPHWETLGMVPCPRCRNLTYEPHGPLCDLTPQEIEELEEEEREQQGRPDADWDEVVAMLGEGPVDFVDPLDLEQFA